MTLHVEGKKMLDLNKLRKTSTAEVIKNLKGHLATERRELAVFLVWLGEFAERRLYLPEGAPSLFAYLVEKLGFCESSAGARIAVARAMRRHPVIFRLLEEGKVHLTALNLISGRLTEKNADELISAVCGKSRREIERVLAEMFPQSDKKPWVRKASTGPGNASPVPPSKPSCVGMVIPAGIEAAIAAGAATEVGPTGIVTLSDGRSSEQSEVRPASSVKQLSASSVRVAVTFDRATFEIIERLRELMPGNDIDDVLAEAVRLLQEKKDPVLKAARAAQRKERREKLGVPSKQKNATDVERESVNGAPIATGRGASSATDGRTRRGYISRKLWREVFERDGWQCVVRGPDGKRCSAREHLQLDHIVPVALGGLSTADNLRVVCAGHNQWAAVEVFGEGFIKRKIERRRAEARAS